MLYFKLRSNTDDCQIDDDDLDLGLFKNFK